MKIYTEEQVRQIASTICLGRFDFNDTPDDLVNELIPIELPSDGQIIIMSLPKDVGDSHSSDYIKGFNEGAKWVIEQIKNNAH
jgi:hypothetical protein